MNVKQRVGRAMKLILIAAVAAAGLASAAAARAGTVVVPGTADIFAAGLTAPPASVDGGGTLPPDYAVVGGQTLDISATGSAECCIGSSYGPTGPDGFSSNPFGNGTDITNSTGSTVGGFTDSGAFPLVATFANSSGAVGGVFEVGSSLSNLKVPVGATELYFGLPDASGFNGPSGYYSDNGGQFTVSVSAVPEPATWLLLVVGIGGIGVALRRARKTAFGTDRVIA